MAPSIQTVSIGSIPSLVLSGTKARAWLSALLGLYFPMDGVSLARSHSFFSLVQQL